MGRVLYTYFITPGKYPYKYINNNLVGFIDNKKVFLGEAYNGARYFRIIFYNFTKEFYVVIFIYKNDFLPIFKAYTVNRERLI